MKMLMSKLESYSVITRESFACQNGLDKLTCQSENIISSAFTLLQNNNPLLIQILSKISKVGVVEARGISGGGIAP